jgi:plasmid stabilization system protein ParE
MRLEFSRFVESDLEAIGDYIAQDNPKRAITFIREMRERIRAVGENPLIYRVRPEIGEGARMAVVGRYVILFCVVGEIVRIERVVYGGRDSAGLVGGRVSPKIRRRERGEKSCLPNGRRWWSLQKVGY